MLHRRFVLPIVRQLGCPGIHPRARIRFEAVHEIHGRPVKGKEAMRKKPKIDRELILADIRTGMGDIPIMEKYQLSPRLYSKILESLRTRGDINREQVQDRIRSCGVSTSGGEKRAAPRNYTLYTVSVYDANNPQSTGSLNDISSSGLQVSGIDVEVDELVTLLIPSAGFEVHSPFALDAICRWVRTEDGTGKGVAGFEIASVLGKGERELEKLVNELTVADRYEQGA